MKRISLLVLVLLACFLTSCESNKSDLQDLDKLRSEYWKGDINNQEKAKQLDKAYKKYILENPNDTNNPTFLYESADLNIKAFNNINEGLKLFEQVFTKYPQHHRAPDALFTTAFMHETVTGNMAKAKSYYSEFLEKYPQHHLAADARKTLEYWDNPEEMLKNILEQNR